MRIVAQLIDAATDEHIWAETYDRDLTDIFAIQTDVALKIAAALQAELSPDERARIGRPPTADLQAYQLYLQGRQCFTKFTPEGYRQGIALFEQAIARDPGFALAHAALAYAYTHLGIEGVVGWEPALAYSRAKEAVARALALDDGLGEAHGIAGLLRFVCDFDWAGAEREFRLALSSVLAAPTSTTTSAGCARRSAATTRRSRPCGAPASWTRWPIAPTSPPSSSERAGTRRRSRRRTPLVRARPRLRPGAIRSSAGLISRLGHVPRGWRRWSAPPSSPRDARMFLRPARPGVRDRGCARRRRAPCWPSSTGWPREQYVSPYHFAYVHTGLGEHDAAIDWLERAYEQRAGAVYGIKGSFLFADLRGHPRFVALLRKMNLA